MKIKAEDIRKMDLSDLNELHLMELIGKAEREVDNLKKKNGILTTVDFKIGDTVCFNHKGQDVPGRVIKINPKTIQISTKDKVIWNVPPELLKIIDNKQSVNLPPSLKSNPKNKFSIGERVFFDSTKGEKISGVINKINPKTIGVTSDEGARWRVSPSLLKKETAPDAEKHNNFEKNTKKIQSFFNKMEKNFSQLGEEDLAAKQKGTLIGRFIQEQIADGYAYYQITKETASKVKIEQVTGIGDDWAVPYWGEGTMIDKKYAVQNIHRRETLAKLFSGNQEEESRPGM